MNTIRMAAVLATLGTLCLGASLLRGDPPPPTTIMLFSDCKVYQCQTATATPAGGGGFPAQCNCDASLDVHIRFTCKPDPEHYCTPLAPDPILHRCFGACSEPGYTHLSCDFAYISCTGIPG